MKTAIILHGMPSREEYFDIGNPTPSNMHWLPWIRQELIENGVPAETPELPEPFLPVYENWKKVFEFIYYVHDYIFKLLNISLILVFGSKHVLF